MGRGKELFAVVRATLLYVKALVTEPNNWLQYRVRIKAEAVLL